MAHFDAVNIIALAMEEARSINSQIINKYIPRVVAVAPGAVVVHTFAAGKQALSAGTTIRYVGASGPVSFDRWHNSPGAFEVLGSNLTSVVMSFTAAQIGAVRAKVGV
jgi:hypothetical protein